jgi:hypothetical protein
MLAVLPALSVSVMELRVRVKAASWSEGASVMRTGTVAVCALTVVALFGATALEQLESRPTARARLPVSPRKRVILEVGVLTFMVVLRREEDVNLLGCNRRVYAGEDYGARGIFGG